MRMAIAALLLTGMMNAGPVGDSKPKTNKAAETEVSRAEGLRRDAEARQATCQYRDAERLLSRADATLAAYQPANGREADRVSVIRQRYQAQLRAWKQRRESLEADSARVTALVRAGDRMGASDVIERVHAPACDARFVLTQPAPKAMTARR